MSMLSNSVLSNGDGPRRRHPAATTAIVVLMMLVLFGAAFGAVRLVRGGGDSPDAGATTPGPCVTTTVRPGLVLPKPGQVTANVFNATSRAGLARRTSDQLKSRGFVIAKVANDPLGKSLTTVAEIRYGPAGLANAQLMRYYVQGATLVLDKRADATVDVVLGAKFVAITPQPVVDTNLAKPVPTASGAGCASPTAKPTTKPTTKPTGTTSATTKPSATVTPSAT
jgi:hypothetical protein